MSEKLNIGKEVVKFAVGFKALNMGLISTMSDADFEKFMAWIK